MRGEQPSEAELAVLNTAIDACCDDRDVDTLVTETDQELDLWEGGG